MKDRDTYLIQCGLKSLGFNPGPLDGDEGPRTRSARKAWEESIERPSAIAMSIVSFAKDEIGIRETSKNQGPGIAKYWSATSYPDGYRNREPYCAAAVCWIVKQAAGNVPRSFSLPTSPVAYDFEKWAAANAGRGIIFVDSEKAMPGDIFTLAAASHVGIVESVKNDVATTLEANTDGSGSREGDGYYRRHRNLGAFRRVIRVL